MLRANCYTKRDLNITLGVIFLMLSILLILTGLTFLHVISFLLAALSFGMALRFFFIQKDITCLFTK